MHNNRAIDTLLVAAGLGGLFDSRPTLAQIAPTPAQQNSLGAPPAPKANPKPGVIETIVVTAKRRQLFGTASTDSEGVVDDQELQLTPVYRPGQSLETVRGLIVTLHSGEGKANQYLMRGYNLDHGTDLETYVDDMPINQPTHAHGQGYTALTEQAVVASISDSHRVLLWRLSRDLAP